MEKNNTLMKNDFLLADPNLKVHREREIKQLKSYLFMNLHYELKCSIPRKFRNLFMYCEE